MVCNLSFIVKSEGVLKVSGSDVYFKSGSICICRPLITLGV